MSRKLAAHRIILSDGTCLPLSVVELDDDGFIISHHSLIGEEAGVEFHVGELRLDCSFDVEGKS